MTPAWFPVGADGDFRARITEAIRDTPQHDRFRLGMVKLYADDVIEPHTAAMLEDYANRPGHRGHTSLEPLEFTKLFVELDRLGYQVHTHGTILRLWKHIGCSSWWPLMTSSTHLSRPSRSPQASRANATTSCAEQSAEQQAMRRRGD